LELAAMTEPDLREQLLADYLAREDRIEKAATVELWELGDWLAEYVPPRRAGRRGNDWVGPAISLEDLAERGRRSVNQLQTLRKIAMATEVDRLPQITPTAYHEALRATGWDLMAANQRLVERGTRKRDQREGPHESLDAIKREAAKRSPEDRAELARELMAEPTVAEIMQGEPLPDFGAAWADKYVVRLDEQAAKLAAHVKREGLVFSPNPDLETLLRMLERTELRIAEVRAAVQERIRDEQMREVI
jgi:hypothetical protein